MKTSAGLLVYKNAGEYLEVLLVHPGGPFFAKKDLGVWSVPKGEIREHENMLDAAKREFKEELGMDAPKGDMVELGSVRQAGGKTVFAWAIEGDIDTTLAVCNTVKMQWPPRSGKVIEFPENDKTEWFPLALAAQKINPAQIDFLHQLARTLELEFGETQPDDNPPQQSLF